MKRFISALTAISIAASYFCIIPLNAKGEDMVYEFEDGIITDVGESETTVVAVETASNGKGVDLKDSGDSVSVKVNADASGSHALTIRYSQPYDEGGKYQDVIVNGENVGQIFCEYTEKNSFKTTTVTANLKSGENTVTIQAAWGWTILDCLTIEVDTFEAGAVSGQLSNPNATAKTKSLYSFLCDTYGNHILSGQQESTWMGSSEYEMNIIKNASGKLPVIRGLDYMNDDFSGCNKRAKEWYSKGGIVTICWHCGSDFSGSHSESLATDLDWDKALTPGTSEYDSLIAGMDKGAKALKELQEDGIPVIWRPFHEFDGQWFWWGKGGAENFKKLWQIMYDRYTNYWKLDNLIWSLGYSGSTKDGWYPGDEYVDIIGSDTYVDHTNSLVNMYRNTAKIADKPVCLHENGSIPDPDKLAADGAKWLWFMTWHTSFIDSSPINTAEYLKKVYNSDYVLTLDELPDVYNYSSNNNNTDNKNDKEKLKGDINGDGNVNIADAVILQKYLLGTEKLTEDQYERAKLTDDNDVDVFDMVIMRKLILKDNK